MKLVLLMARRELAASFRTPGGYLMLASVMFLTGLSVLGMAWAANGEALDIPITEAVYSSPFFWIIVLLSAPAVTMGTYAQERASGAWETLMTAPVGSLQVVIAKFLAAWIFFLLLWAFLPACLYLLAPHFDDPSLVNWRILLSSLAGIGLLGALYVSMGTLASSLVRSQALAAVLAFALGMLLFLQSFLAFRIGDSGGAWAGFFAATSLFLQLEDFVRGVIDSRHIAFQLSLTGLFLYLNWQAVEARRWL